MSPLKIYSRLRRQQVGVGCVLTGALEVAVFRIHHGFIIHLYGRPAERTATRTVLKLAEDLGFSVSELITGPGAEGVAADYAQVVLNATNSTAASAKIAALLRAAAKGKPLQLYSVPRLPAIQFQISADM